MRPRIHATLEQVGLHRAVDQRVRTFSAGMKRRLCFARVLLQDPDIVLLDEPFGQLDPAGMDWVTSMVQQLQANNKTTVISTHDIPRGQHLCSHHLQLKHDQKPTFDRIAS